MEYIKVGKIAATRGLNGEVKIKSLTNMQDKRFLVGNILYVQEDDQYLPLEILSYRVIKDIDILAFKGYEEINKIEKYRGYELFMEADYDIELNDNEFFIDDLVGLKVYQNKILKGTIIDVATYPQGDYLVIETENGDKLIPFRDEFIEEQSEEFIAVIDMEGLL